MHTRFPVTARVGDPQGIVGYVNFKDIVAQLRLSPRLIQRNSLRVLVRKVRRQQVLEAQISVPAAKEDA